MKGLFDKKTVLVTGGTGSFGKKFAEIIFTNYKPRKLIIFSRDEYKQHQMSKIFPRSRYPIRFFLGDVRDKERLERGQSTENVSVIIEAIKDLKKRRMEESRRQE